MAPTPPVSTETGHLTEPQYDRFKISKQQASRLTPEEGSHAGAEVAEEVHPPAEKASEVDPKVSVPAARNLEFEVSSKARVHRPPKVTEVLVVEDKVPNHAIVKSKVTGTQNAVETNYAAYKEHILKKLLCDWNREFQHYYSYRHKQVDCKKCEKVAQLLNHKDHHEMNDCHKCQLINGIRLFHKSVCQLSDCSFCRPIQENENVDHAQDCANPRSQKSKTIAEKRDDTDRISAVFTQASGGAQKGTPFIEGTHYTLGKDLGEGGCGVVKQVKLLKPGMELVYPDGGFQQVAAKVANVDDNESKILQTLMGASGHNIVHHLFMVDSNKKLPKMNCRQKRRELKHFKQIIFMERAEMSLKDYKNRSKDSVLSLKEATTYFLQVAHGVDYAHSRGIFHNDIKSSNVLLFANYNGKNEYTANLCDFEFARRYGCPPGRVGGTLFFQAPETDDGPAKDIYALGIFFLEITIARTSHFPKSKREWPKFKEELVKELKRKHLEIGVVIEACLMKKIELGYLKKKLYEIGGDEGWWPVSSNALGL